MIGISMPEATRHALAFVDARLCRLPAMEHIVRPELQPHRVVRFVLPLDLCKPTNRTRGRAGWAQGADKRKVRQLMETQFILQGRPLKEPLPGRPQVNAVRFSSVEPDKYADWAKAAVDHLCAPTRRAQTRLNIIQDDAPKYAEVNQWWEPAPPKKGFVYLEVRSEHPRG